MAALIGSDLVWKEIEKRSFAVLSYVNPKGQARSAGIVYVAIDRVLYVRAAKDSWKAKLTTSSLRFVAERSGNTNVDARRYRPNLVIDTGDAAGLLEPGWEGTLLEVGDCRIRIETRTVRCSIPGRAQAIAGIDADKGVVRAVAEHADRHMGAYASIEKAGTVRVGDEVRLIPRGARPIADGLQRIQRAALRSLSRRLLRE